MKRNTIIQLAIAFLFSFMGGFCDGYTFLTRGGMFSYMQTGNLIKFCIALANGTFEIAFLIPIVVFCLGCIVAIFISKYKYYTYITTILLLASFVSCSFCPDEYVWNIVCVSTLSFVGAMQFQAFNKCLNFHYTSTMCTNNMRLFSSNLANKNFVKALFYLSIILSFALGVIISVFVIKAIGLYALAISASIFVVILILLFISKDDIKIDDVEVTD